MNKKCILCDNPSNQNYVSYVHKWREYGGYSQNKYPRFLCSQECLNNYDKNYKCNYCHIVVYDWRDYKECSDGYIYCNDIFITININDTTCYNKILDELFKLNK